jgi:hypothetical protein
MLDQRQFFKNFTPVEAKSWSVKGIGNAQLDVLGYGDVELTLWWM